MEQCDNCGMLIPAGSTVVTFNKYLVGRCYCSHECAKEALVEVLDDIMYEHCYESVVESDDPYENYGVSRSDF